MTGEDLFAALSDVDEKFLAQQQPKARRAVFKDAEKTVETEETLVEDTSSPRRDRGWSVLGTVIAACLAVLVCGTVFLGWLFSRPIDWGTEGSTAWTCDCCRIATIYHEPEPTSGADLPEPSFRLRIGSIEEYRTLVDARNLSDAELTAFLEENGYADMGLTTGKQLDKLKTIMAGLPVPVLGDEQPEEIYISDAYTKVEFSFDGVVMEVQRESSSAVVEHKTRGLGLVWQYTNYPLYFGSVSQAGGIVTAHYVLNVDDHAVELQVEAGSEEEALGMLDDLSFVYLNVMPRDGTYEGPGNGTQEWLVPQIYLDMENAAFISSASAAHSFALVGSFTIDGDSLTVTVSDHTFVFAITDSETLLLVDSGGFEGWLKEGDCYRWVKDS